MAIDSAYKREAALLTEMLSPDMVISVEDRKVLLGQYPGLIDVIVNIVKKYVDLYVLNTKSLIAYTNHRKAIDPYVTRFKRIVRYLIP